MPDPSTHLHTTGVPYTPADPDWKEWDRAWTRHITTLTGRTDLSVVVAPGAGGGAPACFYPLTGRVEVDAAHIGDPKITDPRRAGHKKAVPFAYGLLVHEAGHAVHSRWNTPDGTPPVVAHVADLLEESRIEGRQRGRRRGDRRWLRHAATTLIGPDDAPVDDAWHAAGLAALLLARVDARILTAKDVKAVRAAVTTVLGRQRLLQLRDIWRHAHTVDDTDAATMIDLAWRWCRVLGIDPHLRPNRPVPDPAVFAGALAKALGEFLAAALGITPTQLADRLPGRHAAPATWWRRDPTAAEQRAALHLAARLRKARTSSLEPDTKPAAAPPGRLRTRQVITAQAQRDAGQIPTTQPWRQRTHQPPHKPKLHLAVLVDVSGSMGAYRTALSSAGWILAHGARRTDAATTTIAFGGTATLLVAPGQRPTHVLEMGAGGGTTAFTQAVKLADHLLDLRRRTTVRMLAVVSDGAIADPEPAQRLISTLHRTGCVVLWLHPADMSTHTFADTTTITVTDPVDAIEHIARAATTALEHA